MLGVLAVGCVGSPVASRGVGVPTTAAQTSSPATAGSSTTLVPAVSPTPSSGEPATFVTPSAPDPRATWTGITWQRLAADDPVAHLQAVVRWRGGFVALGEVVASDAGSRTQVWVSSDGRTWRPLGADVFGPTTVVVGVGETATGIVALTLHGGTDQCNGQATPQDCWSLAAPLQSWTSSDAETWAAHPGPADIARPAVGCEGCGIQTPIFRSGVPGLLVVAASPGTSPTDAEAAFSSDGITWDTLPADAFPVGFELATFASWRSGFVGVGTSATPAETISGDPGHAIAVWSADGRHWVPANMSLSGLDPLAGSTGTTITVGPDGLIATGSTFETPGLELWWSSASGNSWSRLLGYPPLGVWTEGEEGSGLIPNGTLVGNGERMLAYRGGETPLGWTSLDGRAWESLAVSGSGPTNPGPWPTLTLVLTPFGLLGTRDNGGTWLGAPQT
jgi:hypothetical protein